MDKQCSLHECLEKLIEQQVGPNKSQPVEDDGFLLVAKECEWPNLFGQYFMDIDYEESEGEQESKKKLDDCEDDMLFYVQSKPGGGDGGQEVKVFRKTSPNLPGLGDPHINWEESVYLNMLMHHLQYTLTCVICVRLPTQDLKVLCKKSLKVHASHHMRRMDSKGESSDLSYPSIFFMVDSYEEVFESLSVQEGEIVCVELTANFKDNSEKNFVIFLGSVKHEALLTVYQAKRPLGSKVVQKISLSWMNGGGGAGNEHFEYIRMRGPHGKGYAEMRIGLCRSDLVEHNNINRYRDTPDNKTCSCHVGENEEPYNPTTTLPVRCPKCNTGGDTVWSSTWKWFQQKKGGGVSTLSPNLTYVTLPWSRIMKDVLQVRQKPVFLREPGKKSCNATAATEGNG